MLFDVSVMNAADMQFFKLLLMIAAEIAILILLTGVNLFLVLTKPAAPGDREKVIDKSELRCTRRSVTFFYNYRKMLPPDRLPDRVG